MLKSAHKLYPTTTTEITKETTGNGALKTAVNEQKAGIAAITPNQIKKRASVLAGTPIPPKRGCIGNGAAGGLSSVLGVLGKQKKLSVLEKSKLDWTTFKKQEGIEEELQTHNKGKDGYLDRQDFLQRIDYRQYEIEKSLRNSRGTQ